MELFNNDEIKTKYGYEFYISYFKLCNWKNKKLSFKDLNNINENEFIEKCKKIISVNNNENNLILDYFVMNI